MTALGVGILAAWFLFWDFAAVPVFDYIWFRILDWCLTDADV